VFISIYRYKLDYNVSSHYVPVFVCSCVSGGKRGMTVKMPEMTAAL
jgi:hypothetical protein